MSVKFLEKRLLPEAAASFLHTEGVFMRLDKYLAETAQCTRSEAKTLLNRGRVTVNGAVCKKGDTQEILNALRTTFHRFCRTRITFYGEIVRIRRWF